MDIVTVVFDAKGSDDYERLYTVFQRSVKKHNPHANLIEKRIPRLNVQNNNNMDYVYLSNTLKLREWYSHMQSTTSETVFMDCDMLVRGDLSSAFDEEFDIGYTTRTGGVPPYTINGGVVFVRPTEAAALFFKNWLELNERMFRERKFHKKWERRYAGINQPSFGYLLENPLPGVSLRPFPCAQWNACHEDYENIDEDTKAIHCKGLLRNEILAKTKRNTYYYNNIVREWRSYLSEQEEKTISVFKTANQIRKERGEKIT